MPKIKTNKAAKKRFKVTKTGKILASGSFRRHLLADRPAKRKRQARKWREVDVTDRKRVMKLLRHQL